MPEIKLNVGCGKDILDGWVNIDLYQTDDPRVVAGDIRSLNYAPGSISAIRAIDVLEHIPRKDTAPTLKSWYELLGSGGTIEIRCPDIRKQCELLINGTWDAPTFAHMMFGGQDSEGNFHKAGFTCGYLCELLKDAGFAQIRCNPEHDAIPIAGNANFRIAAVKP